MTILQTIILLVGMYFILRGMYKWIEDKIDEKVAKALYDRDNPKGNY